MKGAALLALLALAGCGGAAAKPAAHAGPKGIVRFCTTDVFDREAAPVVAFNRAHARQGLSARLVRFKTETRFEAALKAGHCDVAELNTQSVGSFAAGGSLRDLSAHVRARQKEFFPSTLAMGHYAGKYWGVPLWVEVGLLYARTETLPATLQEVFKHGGFIYGDGPDTPLAFLETAYAAGGRVLTPDGRHSALDSPENRRALSLILWSVRHGKLRGGSGPAAFRRFTRGHATYMRNWSAGAQDYNLDDHVNVAALPPFAGGKAATLMLGSALVVSRAARNLPAALAFIDGRVSVRSARLPARQGMLSPLVKSYDDYELTTTPGGPSLKGALERAVPPPVSPHTAKLADAMALAVNAVLHERMSVARSLHLASRLIDQILATDASGDES